MKKKRKLPSIIAGLIYAAVAFGSALALGFIPALSAIKGFEIPIFLGGFAFILGWAMTAMIYRSNHVWDKIYALERDVQDCEDPKELRRLNNEVLIPLSKEGIGSVKLTEIYAIINTKLKYISEDK